MAGPRVRTVALVLAVVLSGCALGAAPQADETGTTTADGGRGVPLAEHPLSEKLDANRTFQRVERMVGEDVDSPAVRVLGSGDAGGGAVGGFTHTPYRFAEYLDLRNVSTGGGPSAAGLTDGFGRVYILPGSGPTSQLRQVLVHEFVHVVQFRSGMLPGGWPVSGNDTTDAGQVRLTLLEGAAVYVADEYTERHLPGNVSRQSEQIAGSYARARVGGRFAFARYYFGSAYVADRLDSPDQLRSLYENPPETTEQILHGDTDDPYEPLSVRTSASGWTVEDPDDVDIMGELFVRVTLSRALSLEAAADAADGWGNDRVVEYERADGNETGFAWVLRWDDAANATEFREAIGTYVDRRETGPGLSIRAETVGEQTVAVFLGPPDFVEAGSVSGTSSEVRVTVEG